MKFLRLAAATYVAIALLTAAGLWFLSWKTGSTMGAFDALLYGFTWPVTWLLGLIFWLAAERR